MIHDEALRVTVGKVTFKNPFYIASGPTARTPEQLVRAEECGWAGVSIKLTMDPPPYINLLPRYGYFPRQNFLSFTAEKRLDLEGGLHLVRKSRRLVQDEFIILANIAYAGEEGPAGWAEMCRRFEAAGADGIELNMCCPNMSYNVELSSGATAAGPRSGASLGQQTDALQRIVAACKKAVTIPILVKITPEGGRVAQAARACYQAGADACGSSSNLLGMPPINLENPAQSVYHLQKEVSLSCLGGRWLKPLALRCAYETRRLNGPEVRITATGGVENWQDAVEMALCGADLVGVCTATLVHGYDIARPIICGVREYLARHGYTSWRDLRDRLVTEVTTAGSLTVFPGTARISDPRLAAPCKAACPDLVPAQGYVRKIAVGDFAGAYRLITSRQPLPSVCAYICTHPCETACTRGDWDEPIRIRDLKRFVLEYAAREGWQPQVARAAPKNKKVAVVGAGPAGIACAWELCRAGYEVTIFEAAAEPGGMLRYGVPSFRLPRSVLRAEIAALEALGARIKTGRRLGRDLTLEGLLAEFAAVFLGVGAGSSRKLGCPGEDGGGVWSALEFLQSACQGDESSPPVAGRRVAVIGGGFTALDAARVSLRLGAKEVFLLYRRTREEMPAAAEEVSEAEEEGVRVMYLVAPVEVVRQDGRLKAVRMAAHTLGEPDDSGRRRPEPVGEAQFELPCEIVINAVGQRLELAEEGLELERGSALKIDPQTGATTRRRVFAGGDAVTGPATVIAAVAGGRRAAVSIDKLLCQDPAESFLSYDKPPTCVSKEKVLERQGNLRKQSRIPLELLPPRERARAFEPYLPLLTEQQAMAEVSRCLACGCGEGCELCRRICTSFAVTLVGPDTLAIDAEKCVACGMCFYRCPNRNIEMARAE